LTAKIRLIGAAQLFELVRLTRLAGRFGPFEQGEAIVEDDFGRSVEANASLNMRA
jgi:hypothetical protein